jgi:hypothetical protein
MDSYYRDSSARSPGDRGWGARDDARVKEERGDGYYRGRSPGMFDYLIQFLVFVSLGPCGQSYLPVQHIQYLEN